MAELARPVEVVERIERVEDPCQRIRRGLADPAFQELAVPRQRVVSLGEDRVRIAVAVDVGDPAGPETGPEDVVVVGAARKLPGPVTGLDIESERPLVGDREVDVVDLVGLDVEVHRVGTAPFTGPPVIDPGIEGVRMEAEPQEEEPRRQERDGAALTVERLPAHHALLSPHRLPHESCVGSPGSGGGMAGASRWVDRASLRCVSSEPV